MGRRFKSCRSHFFYSPPSLFLLLLASSHISKSAKRPNKIKIQAQRGRWKDGLCFASAPKTPSLAGFASPAGGVTAPADGGAIAGAGDGSKARANLLTDGAVIVENIVVGGWTGGWTIDGASFAKNPNLISKEIFLS